MPRTPGTDSSPIGGGRRPPRRQAVALSATSVPGARPARAGTTAGRRWPWDWPARRSPARWSGRGHGDRRSGWMERSSVLVAPRRSPAPSSSCPAFPRVRRTRTRVSTWRTRFAIAREGDVYIPTRCSRSGACTRTCSADRVPGDLARHATIPTVVTPQFFHLYPAALATADDIVGRGPVPSSRPCSPMLLLPACSRSPPRRAAPRDGRRVAGAVLVTSMMQVWQARYPSTEAFAQLPRRRVAGRGAGPRPAVGRRRLACRPAARHRLSGAPRRVPYIWRRPRWWRGGRRRRASTGSRLVGCRAGADLPVRGLERLRGAGDLLTALLRATLRRVARALTRTLCRRARCGACPRSSAGRRPAGAVAVVAGALPASLRTPRVRRPRPARPRRWRPVARHARQGRRGGRRAARASGTASTLFGTHYVFLPFRVVQIRSLDEIQHQVAVMVPHVTRALLLVWLGIVVA